MKSSDRVYDACVIGAGASGLVCGAELARRGMTTLIIDKNKKSGRKLYATGNGRCNIANAVISASAYYSDSFARQVVNEGSAGQLKRYLAEIGIPLTDKNGYLYPQSMQASSVVWALTDAARLSGAEIRVGTAVAGITRTGSRSVDRAGDYSVSSGGFLLKTETGEEIGCNRLCLAMGSPSAPKLGAAKADQIYRILDDLSLPYVPFEAALCPLETAEDLRSMAGVRTRAKIRVGLSMERRFETEDLTEEGELQITEYGISGIAVFNLSTLIHVGETVSIDLLPQWNEEKEVLAALRRTVPKRSLFGFLNGMLHEQICRFFLTKHFGAEKVGTAISAYPEEDLLRLVRDLKDWRLSISGKKEEMSQASRGGVRTHILSPDTMQVRRDPRIAVTGELCQVTGRCGGYNLMFALISGMRSGRKL